LFTHLVNLYRFYKALKINKNDGRGGDVGGDKDDNDDDFRES